MSNEQYHNVVITTKKDAELPCRCNEIYIDGVKLNNVKYINVGINGSELNEVTVTFNAFIGTVL